MNEYLSLLDQILLSDDVCDRFVKEYRTNLDFKKWLSEIIPEVDSCFQQQQNISWHIYNVMEHILHSVEEMNRQTLEYSYQERRLLSYVMFFHDLGKPLYHKEKERNGVKYDSFIGHNIGSAEITKRIIHHFNFSEEEEKIISKLVFEHDIFLKLTDCPKNPWQIKLSFDSLKEIIKDLYQYGDGNTLFSYLIMIGLSDNRAQNPKMTKESIEFIIKIKDMANQLIKEITSLGIN